jgi:hypothetical protein
MLNVSLIVWEKAPNDRVKILTSRAIETEENAIVELPDMGKELGYQILEELIGDLNVRLSELRESGDWIGASNLP